MIDTVHNDGNIVQKAIATLQGIETSSLKINQIIDMIDGIVLQTNFFTLNTSHETSLVGDIDRAFAVVAANVGALVHLSNDAAKEIRNLLSISGLEVEGRIQLITETKMSLQKIIERVTEITNVVAQIAASAEEQALGLQEINLAIGHLDKNAQQIPTLVEQASVATRNLTEQSGELARVVARFTAAAAGAINRVLDIQAAAPSALKQVSLIGFTSNHGWEELE